MCDALSGHEMTERGIGWCGAQGSVKILDALSARWRALMMCRYDNILICMEIVVPVEV